MAAELGQSTDPRALVPGDPAAITRDLQAVSGNIGKAESVHTGLKAVDPGRWTGSASDAFRTSFGAHLPKWVAATDRLGNGGQALADYATVLTWGQSEAQRAIELYAKARAAAREAAADHAVAVQAANDTGGPMPVFQDPSKPAELEAHSILDHARRRVDEAGTTAAQALRLGQGGDLTATGGLMPAQYAVPRDGGGGGTFVAPSGDVMTPQMAAYWWRSLTPQERKQYLQNDPEGIGNLDGLPTDVRDKANRVNLANQRAAQQSIVTAYDGVPSYVHHTNEERVKVDYARRKLAGLDAIQDRLDHPVNGKQAYLLKVDSGGALEDGKYVVAMGNPDTAQHVTTYVPGTGAGLDGGPGGDLARSDDMVASAGRARDQSAASITWVGYDAPDNVEGEAWHDDYAKKAESDLDRFQDGLRASHEGPRAHNTIIGHSYGSTVVGYAAKDKQLDVDDMIFVGSPGVGVDHARDLHMDPKHVWVGAAGGDIVASLGIFGRAPQTDDFGAQGFETSYEGGHSDYWNGGSESLANIGRIISGVEPTPQPPPPPPKNAPRPTR